MGRWVKHIMRQMTRKGGFCLFLRAQLSAQMATLVDFLLTILLVRCFDLYYVYATFIGSFYGGVFNGVVNYKWTFKAKGVKKTHVAIKFFMVWICSIGLNTWGTYLLTELFAKIPWVKHTLSIYFGDYFLISKILVAFVVAICWNYNMQRLFVYKNTSFKKLLRRNQET